MIDIDRGIEIGEDLESIWKELGYNNISQDAKASIISKHMISENIEKQRKYPAKPLIFDKDEKKPYEESATEAQLIYLTSLGFNHNIKLTKKQADLEIKKRIVDENAKH